MATEITMPQLGLTMIEGSVTKWLKKVGDQIKKGDELVEIATDKINNIVEAHEDGELLEILVQEGETVPVKAVLAIMGVHGEKVQGTTPPGNQVPAVSGNLINLEVTAPAASGKVKIVVIGGGPGGYVTAIKAAQLGAEVHLVEGNKLGGTCLNVGCIPTKALLHVSSVYGAMAGSAKFGITANKIELDWTKALKYKDGVVRQLVGGVEGLLTANGVKIHKGRGVLKSPTTVQVGTETIKATKIILAVGSEPSSIPIPGANDPGVMDSTDLLSIPVLPEDLVIIGGGVIGIEFASLFATLGTKVTIIEALPRILPPIDDEIATLVTKDLTAKGIEIRTGARVQAIEKNGSAYVVKCEYNGVPESITGHHVLMAVGRRACTTDMGLEEIGITMNRGKIVVDDNFRTNLASVYAVGDCNGKMMLAHAASAQGIAAVTDAMGLTSHYNANTVPSCIYIDPEVASVGAKEEELKQKGIKYKVGKFQLSGNGKTLVENGGIGIIKILADAKYGEVLGIHIMGPRATELIAAGAMAIRLEATTDELTSTIWAHPTVSEAIGEAALAVDGNAIHWPPAKKS